MKFYPVRQGSVEWVLAKVGIPSSSNFERIVTPAKLQLSSQAEKYACELIAEQLLNAPLEDYASALMSRGESMEHEALGYYSLIENVDVQPGGFAVRDDRKAGASPDGFVGNDGLIVRGLEDPVTRATVVMVGLLSGLSQSKRDRVIRNTQEALNDAAEDDA